ncbi:MAG: DNA double-strand break repair nuclease NurA [Candidatus Methanoliparum thermophilum]|uniref:DNA double-strand break repair nuclease NurA n=1 Tax=Methanoliparum thermophilum TaxID=2491083 RepID=A0A520KSM4_METT2|nr:MAG: DNA double-strand break repair nuclease NurA [Candidatus Methanoliparum thermophilum]
MPEFLAEYIKELKSKSDRIGRDFVRDDIKNIGSFFNEYWVEFDLSDQPSNIDVLAIDSSSAVFPTNVGGLFYVVRGLGIAKNKNYKRIATDFDYSSSKSEQEISRFLGMYREHMEHLVGLDSIADGYNGCILLDGSIYGRLSHILSEYSFLNSSSKGLSIDYFEILAKFIKKCEDNRILLIGISKESRTSFFRDFLIERILDDRGLEKKSRRDLLSLALKDKRKAIEKAESMYDKEVVKLIEELTARIPDFQLITLHAKHPGYTKPLLLGASQKKIEEYKRYVVDKRSLIKSSFPELSDNKDTFRRLSVLYDDLFNLPAIVSFHLLPKQIDTAMRIDVPSWYFGISKRIIDVGWPEFVVNDEKINEILNIVSAGYCGLDNYNIWLNMVDLRVKLRKKDFEEIYLPEFEKIVGRFVTARGYRRDRYP